MAAFAFPANTGYIGITGVNGKNRRQTPRSSRKMSPASLDDSTLRKCAVVTSSVNYLGDMDVMPVFYAQQREKDNLVLETHTVDFYDARELPEAPSLETNGFQLVPHTTTVADFTEADSTEETYRREIEELILALTGAAKVMVMNTVLRWSERAGVKSDFVNSHPARFVHVDYSRESFDAFARMQLADAGGADELLSGRYVAYNIWRVLTPPPQDVPLAVCDARTAWPEDVTVGEAVIDSPNEPERRFGSSLYHASPRHRWFWFSDMQPGEALVFKAFDSDRDRVQGCPHSAFDNPQCPPGVPPRASVEIRAFAFF